MNPLKARGVVVPLSYQKRTGPFGFVDYRQLNKITKKDAYPLPHMDSLLDNLGNAKYLSKINLRQAYHQNPLEESSKEATVFAIPGKGLFQFTLLPYGLTNAPASFQRAIDNIFGPEWQPQVFVYMDDILIADTFEKHRELLEKVLSKLKEVGLQVNSDKCNLFCSEIRYLGLAVNKEGLKTDPDKIAPILNFPPPRNL